MVTKEMDRPTHKLKALKNRCYEEAILNKTGERHRFDTVRKEK